MNYEKHLLAAFEPFPTEMTTSVPFRILKQMKSLRFHILTPV